MEREHKKGGRHFMFCAKDSVKGWHRPDSKRGNTDKLEIKGYGMVKARRFLCPKAEKKGLIPMTLAKS